MKNLKHQGTLVVFSAAALAALASFACGNQNAPMQFSADDNPSQQADISLVEKTLRTKTFVLAGVLKDGALQPAQHAKGNLMEVNHKETSRLGIDLFSVKEADTYSIASFVGPIAVESKDGKIIVRIYAELNAIFQGEKIVHRAPVRYSLEAKLNAAKTEVVNLTVISKDVPASVLEIKK